MHVFCSPCFKFAESSAKVSIERYVTNVNKTLEHHRNADSKNELIGVYSEIV